MMNSRWASVVCAGLMCMATSGCGKDQYLYVQDSPTHVNRQYPVKEVQGSNKIDIVWVIDNSGSMGNYQTQVIQNANAFMKDFILQKLDWKMGVISTDDADAPYAGFSRSPALDASVKDSVNVFSDAVGRLGTSGSAIEETFNPLLQHLEADPSFLRSGTPLAVIMVTDAQEQSRIDPTVFMNRLNSITQGRNVFSYGIFASRDFGCRSDEGDWNYRGSPYEAFIKASYVGQTFPLCTNFGTSLVNIAHDIVTRVAHTAIYLTARPDTSTLKVLYQGKELPAGPAENGGAWMYDYGLNAIVFNSLDFAVNDSDSVQIIFDEATE
jgi:hypothetical protein